MAKGFFDLDASRPIYSIKYSHQMPDSNSKKILIVEDNEFVRMQIAGFLKGVGYTLEEAADGTEALKKLDSSIGLIILDVRMEPMGGFEFVKNIHGQNHRVPIILLTGDQNNDLLEQASHYSINIVMLKPVQKDRLIATVQRLLGQAAS